MQPQAGRQLAAKLQVRDLTPSQGIAQHLLDRVPPKWQVGQARHHLEAGQGFLKRPLAPHQLETAESGFQPDVEAAGHGHLGGRLDRSIRQGRGALAGGGWRQACSARFCDGAIPGYKFPGESDQAYGEDSLLWWIREVARIHRVCDVTSVTILTGQEHRMFHPHGLDGLDVRCHQMGALQSAFQNPGNRLL
jgi:hypothetical protein